jgi:peptide/nickel transport system permease protein
MRSQSGHERGSACTAVRLGRAMMARSPVARILAARLLQAVATALVLATLCFAFVHALPGDAALRIAAARMGEDRLTEAAVARIRQEEGLDRPLLLQYAHWVGRLAQGDFGRSLVTRQPVLDTLFEHARFTLGLGLAGWALSYLLALPIGVAAGMRPGRWLDRATQGLAVLLASTPTFLIGIGLISVFALSLRWLPPAGYRTGWHMVLPALTLALGLAAYSVRVIRNAVVDVRAAFFMTFAEMRGLSPAGAFRRHGVRNAAVPVVTFMALQMGYVVDGFVVIETLFNYPGLGDLLVRSLLARDIPMIMGAGILIGLMFALANLVADLACFWLDPRQRLRPAP